MPTRSIVVATPAAKVINAEQSECALNDGASRTIAFLIRGDETYGVRQGTLTLLQGLREVGWCTPVFSMQKGVTATTCREFGFEVHDSGFDLPRRPDGGTWSKLRHHLNLGSVSRQISRWLADGLRREHADALHVRWPELVTVAGRAALACDVRCFWHLPTVIRGGRLISLPAMFYQLECWRYGVVPLANSKGTAATLGKCLIKPKVLYLGVDAKRFNPTTVHGITRAELGIPENAAVFGMFGRIVPEKGQGRVLEALLSITDANIPLHLLLVGGPDESPYVDSLRQTARRANAEDRLHVQGQVDDPERYYNLVDVAVNAFLGSEGFGIAVVEAMMMGKPVLVHAKGGPAETVVHGETGWHAEKATVEVLANTFRMALSNRSKWEEMGKAARTRALNNYSTTAFCKAYGTIVNQYVKKSVSCETGESWDTLERS